MFPPPELGSSTRPASPRPPAFITPRRSSLGTGPSPSSESSSSSPSTTRIFVAIRPTPVPPDVPSGGFLPGKLLDGSRAFSSPPTPPHRVEVEHRDEGLAANDDARRRTVAAIGRMPRAKLGEAGFRSLIHPPMQPDFTEQLRDGGFTVGR